jgi:hypothetical protein
MPLGFSFFRGRSARLVSRRSYIGLHPGSADGGPKSRESYRVSSVELGDLSIARSQARSLSTMPVTLRKSRPSSP